MNTEINIQDCWTILDNYFYNKGLVKHQIDSYDEFLCDNINKIIESSPPIIIETTKQVNINQETKRDGLKKKNTNEPQVQTIKHVVKLTHSYVGNPCTIESSGELTKVTPNMCRLRNLTYDIGIYFSLTHQQYEIKQVGSEKQNILISSRVENSKLCNVPLMLKSKHCVLYGKNERDLTLLGECDNDQGGYFIVNGSEKVLIAQEKMATNQVYIFLNKLNNYVAEIRSSQEGELKSASQVVIKHLPPPKKNTILTDKIFRVSIPYIKKDIPIVILFKALGILDDKKIIDMICNGDKEIENILQPSFDESFVILTQEHAIEYIGKRSIINCDTKEKRLQNVRKILCKDMLSHVSVTDNNIGEMPYEIEKAFFLAYMTKKLICTILGRRDLDDRDSFGNKRLDLASNLLGSLFRNAFNRVFKEFAEIAERHIKNGKNIVLKNDFKGKDIGTDLKYAMSTGNWGATKQNITKTGVSQVLNRLSYASTLSHLRRIAPPTAKDSKTAKPRQLHNTHFMTVCPAETPEGHACGLIKNLSLMTHISMNTSSDLILLFLTEFNIEKINTISSLSKKEKIFLNGNLIGLYDDIFSIKNYLLNLRRTNKIPFDVSIKINDNELIIDTDGGRCCSPYFIVDKLQNGTQSVRVTKEDIELLKRHKKKWDDLIMEEKIEYIDVNEQSQNLIATRLEDLTNNVLGYEYTHCIIHPSMMLGVCASIVPFPDHNQAPRNTYESAMSKQAMGMYTSSHQMRMDTLAHVLAYPQKPLVQTKPSKYINYNDMPSGVNAIVAVACYSGFNQEDSVILNQSSVDRGIFRSVFYRSYKDEENKKKNEIADEFCKPNPVTVAGTKNNNYDNLDRDGLPTIGSVYKNSEILIGKIMPIVNITDGKSDSQITKSLLSKLTHKDCSTPIRSSEDGVVDQVMLSTNLDGKKFVKVRMRSIRIPEIGDKIASRHGQKGTIGMMFKQEDMPFTIEGITPDVIINPHCLPSRMTIGQLIESVSGKVSLMTGSILDATPFEKLDTDKICDALHSLGYEKHGSEVLYNGMTGQKINAKIFIGPVYYQRLKHLVQDKQHSRSYGPLQNLIRQPTEGRSRDGGLRFGEMERDCMISHGAANFLRDKMFIDSDKFKMYICSLCGLMAIANKKKDSYYCKVCKTDNTKNINSIVKIDIPYATKLLFQELMAMGIAPRIKVNK